jgi:hypothetical protein
MMVVDAEPDHRHMFGDNSDGSPRCNRQPALASCNAVGFYRHRISFV